MPWKASPVVAPGPSCWASRAPGLTALCLQWALPVVGGLLVHPSQFGSVVEEVGRQQESQEREEQEAQIHLKDKERERDVKDPSWEVPDLWTSQRRSCIKQYSPPLILAFRGSVCVCVGGGVCLCLCVSMHKYVCVC